MVPLAFFLSFSHPNKDYCNHSKVIMCLFVYFSGYTCVHIHRHMHSHTHCVTTNRMRSVRGSVIRGIVFSDSQREFPYSYCQKSDHTHTVTERHKDRHKERGREEEMCYHMKWQTTLTSVTSQLVTWLWAKHATHTLFFLFPRGVTPVKDKDQMCLSTYWVWEKTASWQNDRKKYSVGCFLNVCTHAETHRSLSPPTLKLIWGGLEGKFTVVEEVKGGRDVRGRRGHNIGALISSFSFWGFCLG